MSDTNEFVVRVGRDRGTKYSMMRFNVPIELAQWNKIQKYNIDLARDMSKQRNFDLKADEGPQFGEGSEYRAREKEIARKMMMGHKVSDKTPTNTSLIFVYRSANSILMLNHGK